MLEAYKCIEVDQIRSHSLSVGNIYFLETEKFVYIDSETNKTLIQVYSDYLGKNYIGRYDLARFQKEQILLNPNDDLNKIANTDIAVPLYQILIWISNNATKRKRLCCKFLEFLNENKYIDKNINYSKKFFICKRTWYQSFMMGELEFYLVLETE